MDTGWIWNVTVAFCLWTVTSVSARTCVLGTEPDESLGGKVRFVLPPGDLCSCSKLRLGGHNTYAPPRKDKPVYIDELPMDAEGLRSLQGCPDESTQRENPTQTSTALEETTESPTTREAPVYTDCQDALDEGQNTSGVYTINPYVEKQFDAYCDMTSDKGYIVIQRRLNGSVDFNRNWTDYKEGFGNLAGEFWFGNEQICNITASRKNQEWELLVKLTAFDGSVDHARYGKFRIKEEKDTFEIEASAFDNDDDGKAFDSKRFSTFDKDHDDDHENCAELQKGGWWYAHCTDTLSNLNGWYYSDATADVVDQPGIYWAPWKKESLKATEMKIRLVKGD